MTISNERTDERTHVTPNDDCAILEVSDVRARVQEIYTDEVWAWIPGYEGYEISTHGRIISYHKPDPRFIGGGLAKKYPTVHLKAPDGSFKTSAIHRLVMLAFVGPRPDGLMVRHLDGNHANSHLSNLAYGTAKENAQDSIRHGTKSGGSQVKTACKWGHPFTEDNIIRRATRPTQRICKTCHEIRRAKRAANNKGNYHAQKTHCKRGHEFTEENTLLSAKGHRACRTCERVRRRESKRAARAAKRAEAA